MERAFQLWDENDSLPPGKKWSMRAMAKEVGIPKTTIIERLSQRRKGIGHIAGGKRQPRVLSAGKFKRVTKRVILTVTVTRT